MKFVLQSKKNIDKSTELFSPIFLKPTDLCGKAMLKAKKGQQKVPVLKKMTGLLHIHLLIVLDGDEANVVLAALSVNPLQLLQQRSVCTGGYYCQSWACDI